MALNNITTRSRAKTVNVTCDTDEQVETLYTCPANCRAHASMMHVVNAGGTVSIDANFVRASSTQTNLGVDPSAHILGGKNMSTGDYIQFTGAEMVLEAGDSVTIVADGSTPDVTAMLTVEEFFTVPG